MASSRILSLEEKYAQILTQSGAGYSTRLRQEALTTPFICLSNNERATSAWKVRILKQDYCGLLTFKEGTPTKCRYCLAHKPYQCTFKVTAQQLLFERLFKNEH